MTTENDGPNSGGPPVKSIRVAYVLALLAGLFGAHRLYLGRWLSGLAYMAVLTLAMIAYEKYLVYALGAVLIVDLLFIPRLTVKRNEELAIEFAEHPERFVVSDAEEIAPWATESKGGIRYVLGTPWRIFQFIFFPILFTASVVVTGSYEFVVFPVIILLASGLITSLDVVAARYPALLEVPGFEQALDRVAEMRQYYWENEPKLGTSLWGMIRRARSEYAPFWKIAGIIALAVVIDSVLSFEDDYSPYLSVGDAAIVITTHVVFIVGAVLLILSPLSALSFHYSLSGKRVRLRVLTVAALVGIGVMMWVGVKIERGDDVPAVLSEQRLELRMEYENFARALHDNIGMFLSYYPLGFSAEAPPGQQCFVEIGDEHCAPTEWLREVIKGVAPNDESEAFRLVDFVDSPGTETPFRVVLFEVPPAPDTGECALAVRYGNTMCTWIDGLTGIADASYEYQRCSQIISEISPCAAPIYPQEPL
ncbi:MAG: TM2 domain-containing protein [Woeseiaceae bacterium]|nr:TM2 domain-containing protein [Woeseiaceae bacterium]